MRQLILSVQIDRGHDYCTAIQESEAIELLKCMNDLGIKSKVHFAGKDKGPKDIYGNYMQYNKGHKNIYITMGGKTYEVNPQPGVPWPLGTVAR
mgnify:CR=1 FL=1